MYSFFTNRLFLGQLSLPEWANPFLVTFLVCIVILFVGWWLINLAIKILEKSLNRANIDAGIISFASSLSKVILRLFLLISVASKMNIDVTSIIATLGAASVAVGFALKDSLSNLASGALIIINKPFSVGDIIQVNDFKGTITKIEMMFSTLITEENKQITIPNSKLTSNSVINYSFQDKVSLNLSYFVDYNCDISKAKSILHNIIESKNEIIKNPYPTISLGDIKDNKINILVKVWCQEEDSSDIYFFMLEKVKFEFAKEGIFMPPNQLDVNIKN